MSAPREWSIRANHFRFEPPDLLWVKIDGTCSLEDATRIVTLYGELAQREGPYFVLSDMEASREMDAEARRYMSDKIEPEWFRAMILYNTRLLHRALARGLILAAEMSRSLEGRPSVDLRFVSTRDKALELLAELRAKAAGAPGQNWK